MINVDPLEIEKFSQLAHRWWDPGSEFKPLHDINPLRLEWIASHAELAAIVKGYSQIAGFDQSQVNR